MWLMEVQMWGLEEEINLMHGQNHFPMAQQTVIGPYDVEDEDGSNYNK